MAIDEAMLAADAAARTAALDITRSFIVQAPAGSGKTEILIQRYLRLLANVEHPEEVLAITFTRKAASEMQLRVLEALERASSGVLPDKPHEQVTHAAAVAVLNVDKSRNWGIVENPRRLKIQTLDALNASIARAQPLTAANGMTGSRILVDAEMRALYAEAAVLTLDQLLEDGRGRLATETVLGHLDNDTSTYVDYLARMLATRDQWLPFVGSGLVAEEEAQTLRAQLEANIEYAVAEHLADLVAVVPEWLAGDLAELASGAARVLASNGNDSSPMLVLQETRQLPGADPGEISVWRGIAELLLTGTGSKRRTVTKAQGFPAGSQEKERMLALLGRLDDTPGLCRKLADVRSLPPLTYTDEQWAVLLALFRLLPLAATELKRLFAVKGAIDHIEIALNAAIALGSADAPGDVALLLDYQLRHLLVDEMQDTSTAQYRMLEALTGGWEAGDGRTLFCVGDPMQSIYRFRNAEVGQFLVAREAGIGGVDLEPLTLRRNFRSGENLVGFFNETFPSVLAAVDDPARSAVAYSPAVAVPGLAATGSWHVHPVFGGEVGVEAATTVAVIEGLLSNDGDIAVLVRGRTQLPELLRQLRNAGVAYRAIEIDRLTDLPEIIELLALTRALCHRDDRLAWLALLRAPWAGLDWTDLHRLVLAAGDKTVWELLGDDERVQQLSSVGRAASTRLRDGLEPFMHAQPQQGLRERVERIWLELGGPGLIRDAHEIDNVYRYLDVLERIETGGLVPDVAELERALDLERVSASVDARVQIMTMHRAKGLQFDNVVLHGLGRTAARSERSVLAWFDMPVGHGLEAKVLSPVGPRAEMESDALHRFIEKTETAKDREETGRLMYVACTRAKQSLHLVGHVAVSADGESLRPPRADSLLRMVWPVVETEFSRRFRPSDPSSAESGEDTWTQPRLRRFAADWRLPAVAALPGIREAGGVGSDRPVGYDWVGTDARLAGTIVHRWLQLAGAGQIDLETRDPAYLQRITRRWLAEAGAEAASVESIGERVAEALRGVVSDPQGRWLTRGEGHSELALTGLDGERVVSVVLDRVRIDEDGTHWIVDYKTSTHEGGGLDSFLAAEADRYRPQLARYFRLYAGMTDRPVRCALYFPLLRRFVEVAVDTTPG